MEVGLKPVRWVGSSLDDLRSFPPEVGKEIGNPLYAARKGYSDPAAKALKGFGGASVLEIRAPFDGDAWRTVYTVRMKGIVYALRAFQKKSKSGVATPKKEIDLIHRRLAMAESDFKNGEARNENPQKNL
jgi:phage-related protein